MNKNKITQNTVLKIAAFFVSVATLFAAIVSAGAIAVFAVFGMYTSSFDTVEGRFQYDVSYDYAREIYNDIAIMGDDADLSVYDGYNFMFEVTDSTGNVAYGNYDKSVPVSHGVKSFNFSKIYSTPEGGYDEDPYIVRIYVKSELKYEDQYLAMHDILRFMYDVRFALIFICALSALVFLASISYVCCAAGHHKDTDGVTLGGFDKIPTDLLAILFASPAVVFGAAFLSELGSSSTIFMIMLAAFAAVFSLEFVLFVMTSAVRIKTGTFLKNTVIWRALKLIGRLCKKIFGFFSVLFAGIPHVAKTVLASVAFFATDIIFFLMSRNYYDFSFVLLMYTVFKLLTALMVVFTSIGLSKIKKTGESMAGGDVDARVDTSILYGDFRRFGDTLNNIGHGMNAALEERMKSERFKTELITNVSHDIKTPLTSIINYVDLIKKENYTDEKLLQYIDVLDRQSARLNKLSRDIVEASKASTGNIEVNLEECDAGVLIMQAVGEYEERLQALGLEAVVTQPDENVRILADGRLIWRVLDNLMSNICKYSQKGTRVYISLEVRDGNAVTTLKNISAYKLNVSASELTERFVRADASRSTEGSGLGLSIATSLTSLQGGELEIFVDGDLFKAVLTFPCI